MNYLHYDFWLEEGDVVEVTLDNRANVRLLDEENFSKYQSGEPHRYHGGFAKDSPVRVEAPSSGHWHVVIDLGGYGGKVRASVKVLRTHAA